MYIRLACSIAVATVVALLTGLLIAVLPPVVLWPTGCPTVAVSRIGLLTILPPVWAAVCFTVISLGLFFGQRGGWRLAMPLGGIVLGALTLTGWLFMTDDVRMLSWLVDRPTPLPVGSNNVGISYAQDISFYRHHFAINISGDGRFVSTFRTDSGIITAEGALDGRELREIVMSFEDIDFFQMPDKYYHGIEMTPPRYRLMLSVDGKEKEIKYYGHLFNPSPLFLHDTDLLKLRRVACEIEDLTRAKSGLSPTAKFWRSIPY